MSRALVRTRLLVAFSLVTLILPSPLHAEGFFKSILDFISSSSAVRGSGLEIQEGSRVMSLNIKNSEEAVIWDCGSCWSPVTIDEKRAAVLKKDGVWVVDLVSKKAVLAVASGSLFAMLGPSKEDPEKLAVVVKNPSKGEGCLTVAVADLKTGSMVSLGGTTPACKQLNDQSFLLFIPKDRVRNGQLVTYTFENHEALHPYRLIVGDIPSAPTGAIIDFDSIEYSVVCESFQKSNPIERFCPHWYDDGKVLYLSKP